MKHTLIAAPAVLALAVSLVAVGGDMTAGTGASGRISTEISIFPTDEPGIWMGEATVIDIKTGEVLAQPQVRFTTGEQAKLRSGGRLSPDPRDEYHVVLEVSVGEAGETATYTSSVTIGGEVVSLQSATFRLK